MNSAKSTLARNVAAEDRVADMSAPHGQALALALLEVAAAHDSPPRVAREHPPARLHLVIQVRVTRETRERAEDPDDRLELPRVGVPAVACDVPPAREHEAGARPCVVEYGLGRSGRVTVDPAWEEHDEHPVAPVDAHHDDPAARD
jgi:hypothetical protein